MSDKLESQTITAPGFKGLNLQDSTISDDSGWALVADNCVFDDAGRIAARMGYTQVNTDDSIAVDIEKMAEFTTTATAFKLISTTSTKIYQGTGTALSNISPTSAPTSGKWKFVTFTDVTTHSGAQVCVGVQSGHSPIIYTGAGIFEPVTDLEASAGDLAGMPIDGNELLAAFGRLWAVGADGVTISWCPLRNCDAATSWTATGSGNLNVSSVWPIAGDYVKALAAFDDKLIIFGEHNILVYKNPWTPDDSATPLTLDSANQLGGTIGGIGCIARDSVQHVGDDLFFLSHNGVRSLRRTLITQTIPETDVSKNNRDDLMSYADSISDKDSISSVYNKKLGFYLLSFPLGSGSSLNTMVYHIDTKRVLPPNNVHRMTRWPNMPINCFAYTNDDTMYFGDGIGFVNKYTGYQDNGSSYTMEYISTWQDFQSPTLKFPKKIKMIVNGGSTYTINFKWAFDFSDSFYTQNTNVVGEAQDPDEYNVATTEYGAQPYANYTQWAAGTVYSEYDIVVPTSDNTYIYWASTAGTSDSSEPTWNTSSPAGTTADNTVVWTTSAISANVTEWSGTANLSNSVSAHLSKNGQHIRYGWSVPIDGNEFAVHRLDIYTKIGRLNR